MLTDIWYISILKLVEVTKYFKMKKEIKQWKSFIIISKQHLLYCNNSVFANNQGQNYEDPATELKSDLLTDQKRVLLKKLKTVLTMLMLIQLKTNLKQLVKKLEAVPGKSQSLLGRSWGFPLKKKQKKETAKRRRRRKKAPAAAVGSWNKRS